MNRGLIFLPFAAVVALSGYIGWQMGQPLSETDVLDFYVADWIETGPEGASSADCFGAPGETSDVWIVVTCAHGDITRQTHVASNGRSMVQEQEPQA